MTVKKASIKIIRREQVEYISRDKYEKVDPLNLTRLHRPFEGQRYISVKDSSYSEGRRRIKTKRMNRNPLLGPLKVAVVEKANKIQRMPRPRLRDLL